MSNAPIPGWGGGGGGGGGGDLTFTPQVFYFYIKYMIILNNQIPQGWGTVSASNAVKIPYKSPPIRGGGGGGGVAIDRCISGRLFLTTECF